MPKYFRNKNRIILNKKGDVSVVSKLIIVLIVLGLLIYGYYKVTKGTNKVLQCTTQGGRCTVGTCDFSSEIPVLSSKAAGCADDQLCCVSVNKITTSADAECKDKKLGDKCTKGYNGYCNLAGQCVTRCEFCDTNPRETTICSSKDAQKFEDGGIFTCSCTSQAECNSLGTKCVPGYCGTSTTSYCCAK